MVLQARVQQCGALRILEELTIPAAETAVQTTHGHIGFLGTKLTVASHTFRTEVAKLNPGLKVTEVAAPLLAPIVEEGWEETDIAKLAVARYLEHLGGDIDTSGAGVAPTTLLLRGGLLNRFLSKDVQIVDPASYVARRLALWFEQHPEFVSQSSAGPPSAFSPPEIPLPSPKTPPVFSAPNLR